MSKKIKIGKNVVYESTKSTKQTGKGYEGTLDSVMGYIDYIVYPEIRVLVFNGSYIEKDYRGKGKYKVLVKRLLRLWPGYEFQCLAVNPLVMYTLTKRFGFKVNNNRSLYHWGFAGADKKGEPVFRMFRGKYTKKGL